MKNLRFIALLFATVTSFATSKSAFDFNEKEIESTFAQVKPLENYVLANPEKTAEKIIKENPSLIDANIDLSPSSPLDKHNGLPFGAPFWWGCCLGFVGLIVVYVLTDNDHSQVRKAFWGCLLSTIVFGGGLIWQLMN